MGGCLIDEMHEKSDTELLREYTGQGHEDSFREIVVRHTDLVYSSALRQVASPDLARDVAQSVFTDLARKAQSIAGTLDENASLLGWLFRSARFAALNQLRDDRRRQLRDRHAMEYFNPASETALEWDQVRPVLDEAMADLGDEDREALLLRFFKSHDFRAIGQSLGVSDDAAQKRVSRALERLRAHLTGRGITATTLALSTALSANAVTIAPVGLAGTLSSTALAATTFATITKAIAMTTLQKTLIVTTIVLAVGTGIYEARRAAHLQSQVRALQEQQTPDGEQIRQLKHQRDDATGKLALLKQENEQLHSNLAELPKLRGEIARLRNDARELAKLKGAGDKTAVDPTESEMKSWLARVNLLKQRLEEMPEKKIPELQWATEQDWLNATKGNLETEADYRRAMSSLRNTVEGKFAAMLQPALSKYIEANNGQFPTDLSQLQSYFKSPVSEAVLQRYAVLPAEEIPSLGMGGKWIITQNAPTDAEYDSRFGIGPNGYGTTGSQSWNDPVAATVKMLDPVLKAYAAANGGKEPGNIADLSPFITTSDQQAALEKVIKNSKAEQSSDTK
jgi:RNA polymerase sigma factor (sigma-70 family)